MRNVEQQQSYKKLLSRNLFCQNLNLNMEAIAILVLQKRIKSISCAVIEVLSMEVHGQGLWRMNGIDFSLEIAA